MELDIFLISPVSGSPLTTGCGSGYIQSATGSVRGEDAQILKNVAVSILLT